MYLPWMTISIYSGTFKNSIMNVYCTYLLLQTKIHTELGNLGNETSQDSEHQQLALATFGGDCAWVQRCQRKHMRMEMCQQLVWENIISMRKQVLQAPSKSNSILWDWEIIIVCAQTLETCRCSGGTLSCCRVSSSWANFDYLWPLLTTVLRLSSLRLLVCMIVC